MVTLNDSTSRERGRTVSSLITLFDRHCNPKVNETVERYNIFAQNQGLDENIDVIDCHGFQSVGHYL